jgi:DNA helicase II / ATP-dependent DNA helicase PcrA
MCVCTLTLLTNNEDRVALRWWSGHGASTERVGPYRRLRQHCEAAGQSPRQALTALASGELQQAQTRTLIERFNELTEQLGQLENKEPAEVINILLPDDSDATRVLREAALLALPECERTGNLFRALRRTVTQPEMPQEGTSLGS